MKNLNRYFFVWFAFFITFQSLCQQVGYTYPIIEQRGSDTLIIFKIDQGKKLAQFNEERKKLISLVELQNLQLSEKDSIISGQKSIIAKRIEIDEAQKVIISEKSKQIDACNLQMDIVAKELKKQKRYKLAAIISGISAVVLTEWLNLKL